MEKSRRRWRTEKASLERERTHASRERTRAIDVRLAELKRTMDLDEASRRVQSMPREPGSQYAVPRDLDAAKDEMSRYMLRNFKVNQALYRTYGGRVIFQQMGPEPLDAYKKLMLAGQKKGTFEIVDRSYDAGFWKYVTDETMHVFVSEKEGRDLMTTQWWLRAAPED
jgi:hypothetical protein